MNILADLFGITELNKRKRVQLQEQELADYNLQKLNGECTESVFNLLLVIRAQSRIDQHKMIDAQLKNVTGAALNEIVNSTLIYNQVNRAFSSITASDQRCRRIREITANMS